MLLYGNSDLVLPEDHAPPEATVKRSSVEHDGVFDVVAGIRHHRDRRVLTARNLWATQQAHDTREKKKNRASVSDTPYGRGPPHLRNILEILYLIRLYLIHLIIPYYTLLYLTIPY